MGEWTPMPIKVWEESVSDLNIQELFDRLPGAFMPDRAAGVNSTVQFNLTGEKGGDWIVRIKDQKCDVEHGITLYPNLTFKADAQDCLDIFTGKLDGTRAFMQGKVKLVGDMGLAMRLSSLFKISNF